MLEELHVHDLALVDDAWMEFAPGMTAITGETGAGKTALLGALKLLVGERGDSGAVRSGASELLVEGRFSVDGTEIIASRRVTAEGRSKARLDSSMASITELAERLGPLVDLHGQHEHQALLSPVNHVRYLDRWAGESVIDAAASYRRALRDYADARAEREALKARIAEAQRRADYLRFVAEEVDRVDPEHGEDVALEARLPALRHAERLRAGSHDAVAALRDEGGATDRLADALVALEKVRGVDPALDVIIEQLRDAQAAVEDTSSALRSYRDGVEADPAALDAVESRLAMLAGLKRKYGPSLDDVLRSRDEAMAALDSAEHADSESAAAERRVAEAQRTLEIAAESLRAARLAAIPGFTSELAGAMDDLSMAGARVDVVSTDLAFDAWGSDGPARVELMFAPAADAPARPLAKIASGGELSRVMLAIKSVLGKADDVPVLVFDEVDAGIGGATAHAVGRRLAELSRTHQVIVVTHLAQVAAYADAQLLVEKVEQDGSVRTQVRPVVDDERVREIARMLSGKATSASVPHAEELLDQARSSMATLR